MAQVRNVSVFLLLIWGYFCDYFYNFFFRVFGNKNDTSNALKMQDLHGFQLSCDNQNINNTLKFLNLSLNLPQDY